MTSERPPLRILRVALITALLLAAITLLVPENPLPVPQSHNSNSMSSETGTLASIQPTLPNP